jgi:hypothetical protein
MTEMKQGEIEAHDGVQSRTVTKAVKTNGFR